MATRIPQQSKRVDSASRVRDWSAVQKVRGLPAVLEVGGGSALRLDGVLEPASLPLHRLRIRLGALERDVDGFGLAGPEDAEELLWWSVVPLAANTRLGLAQVSLLADGSRGTVELPIGEVLLESGPPRVDPRLRARPASANAEPLIAICMATYEPSAEWLERQLDSIRAQSWQRWICLISDDASSPAAFAVLQRAVEDDPRIVVSRSPNRLGFYANFERALRMAPAEAELIAMADQDDRWDSDKLEALAEVLERRPAAALAYSDMRIVDVDGEVLSETFWYLRHNSYNDIASLMIANTVTGAASLFRRELLATALPFPPGGTGEHYHDQWLASCALAVGKIAYLDRPTYDYTRHEGSVTMSAAAEWYAPPRNFRERVSLRWRRMTRRLRMAIDGPNWRDMYLERILMVRQLVTVLDLRVGERITPAKRRSLMLLATADDSPRAAAWLAVRALRPLFGRNETLARERVLVGAILWRAKVVRRARRL